MTRANQNNGFTLVELILVLIILSILGAYVAPRLFGDSEIGSLVFQKRAISILRNMQTRAMQDTRGQLPDGNQFCYQVNFDANNNQLGIPSNNFLAQTSALIQATCDRTRFDTSDPLQTLYIPSTAMADKNVSMSAKGSDGVSNINAIIFDTMGRANQNVDDNDPLSDSCAGGNGCRILFSGAVNAAVCIEAEGYIYAC